MKRLAWLFLAAAACWYDVPDVVDGSVVDAQTTDVPIETASSDASDAGVVDDGGCNPSAPFGTPAAVPGLATSGYEERYARFTPDELTVYFAIAPAGTSTFQLVTATRASTSDPFAGPTTLLAPGNGSDINGSVSSDGLVMLFSSARSNPDTTATQIWSATRTNTSSAFTGPTWSNTTFGAHNGDYDPFFLSVYTGDRNFYYAVRSSSGARLSLSAAYFVQGTYYDASTEVPTVFNAIDDPAADNLAPVVRGDGLELFFASNRGTDGGGVTSALGVWTAARSTMSLPWAAPSLVSELGTAAELRPTWVSANGCRLYLTLQSPNGTDDVYVATRPH